MFIVQRGTKMLWGETVTLGCSLLKNILLYGLNLISVKSLGVGVKYKL